MLVIKIEGAQVVLPRTSQDQGQEETITTRYQEKMKSSGGDITKVSGSPVNGGNVCVQATRAQVLAEARGGLWVSWY